MQTFNRRGLMGILGLLGAGVLRAPVSATPTGAQGSPDWRTAPSHDGHIRFGIDVAVLGHTDAQNTAGRIGDPQSHDFFGTDARGDNFFVEGLIYPAGTIPVPTGLTPMPGMADAPPRRNHKIVWDFTAAKPIGHWFNRGWVLINANPRPYTDSNGTPIDTARVEPYLLSDHTFAFGLFDDPALSPDLLTTSGTEGRRDPDAEAVVRAITGGTGRFARATGQVTQSRVGRNTSTLRSLAKLGAVSAPNYRFEFDVKLA
jgi:hypothetical protein